MKWIRLEASMVTNFSGPQNDNYISFQRRGTEEYHKGISRTWYWVNMQEYKQNPA
jgi:hypothetical protein